MTRVNLVLLLAVLTSALYLVSVQYESRRLFAGLDRAVGESRRIEAEREQLELEQRRQATTQRVEKLAKDKLGLRPASPAITDYVSYQPYSGSVPEGTTVQPRVSGGRLQ
ncbi:MAG: cell division protein FtsL [Curvibacter sp.]